MGLLYLVDKDFIFSISTFKNQGTILDKLFFARMMFF